MNIYYRYKCNTCCIPVLSLDGRRKSSAQQTKKSKNRLFALLHSCSIHWSVQLWGFNFLLFDSHCFFPFSVVCKLHLAIIRREPRFRWNTFVFLFLFSIREKIHRSFIHDSNGNFCCCAQFIAIQFNGNESAIVQKTR